MDFSMLGIAYDGTQTVRKGAAAAPQLLRKAFPLMETYFSGVDLNDHFVEDMGDIDSLDKGKIAEMKNFPVILGGEHTITVAAAEALDAKNIVIFDAHPDCEDSDGHDGVARRLAEKGKSVYLFGVRCLSRKEQEYLEQGKVKVVKDLKDIEGPVYLSIDFDILDPSLLQAVGNPEPDGMMFKQVIEAVRQIADKVVAVDFVEFTPNSNDAQALLGAKLIYAVMSEIIRARV